MAADLLALLVRANLAIGAAILLVLILRRPVRRPFGAPAAYALWMVAPLAVVAVMLPARTVTVPVQTARLPIAWTAPSETIGPASVSPLPSGIASQDRVRHLPVQEALVAAWALVALLAIGVQAERQRRFIRSLGRLRGDAGLFHAEHAGVGPAVIGALLPRVVLPADFAVRFSPEEQALILAHERNHLSAGDAQINALTTAVQCLFWFNPLVHLGASRLRVDQEIACDAAVLTRFPVARLAYGEAMLKTQLAPHAPPLGCHWPARAHKQLKERFAMLNQHRQGRAHRLAGGGAVAALGLGAGFAGWAAPPARRVHQGRRGAPQHNGRAEPSAETNDQTPLTAAVMAGDAAIVSQLLAAGADANRNGGDGTPLTLAARAGRSDLVALLIKHGADASRASRRDGDPLTNAVRSGDTASVRTLLDSGADADQVTPGEGSPLIAAARSGRLDLVTLLLAHGADAGRAARGDGDPLIAAAGAGHLDIVQALVEHGASIESFVLGDETPLINAAQSGDLATVRYLVDKGADVNRAVPANRGETRSPLGQAVKHGHQAVVDYLKAKGARA